VVHQQVQAVQNQAYYTVASPLVTNDPSSGIPQQYFASGHLMNPAEIESKLGSHELASYYASLDDYLKHRGFKDDVDVTLRNYYENVTHEGSQ